MPKQPSSSLVSRRGTLVGLAGGAALAAFPYRLRAHPAAVNPVFRHGIASGDPDATSAVLWTRVASQGEVAVDWQVSDTLDFGTIVRQGSTKTGPERDHTVKALADGLEPGRTYYYRFSLGDATSRIGRTRTLADGPLDRLGIALASCSNFPFGFFNAYDAIARDADIDYVLHTGDYIYEYAADGWGSDTAAAIGRLHEPAHEIVSLADYRRRHAQYKTDTGAQAMHAAHPLLACWDDHESTNNPWVGGAQNHQPDTEGNWNARRAASIRAYYEWMPVREPEWLEPRGRTRQQFWRTYRFGDLATLCTLETRHTARAEQIDYLDHLELIQSEGGMVRFTRDVLGKPGRAMLSPELESDLSQALRSSVRNGQPWRLIGNPMPIAKTDVPDVAAMGLLEAPDTSDPAKVRAAAREGKFDPGAVLAWKGKYNLPFYPDTWDGYPWARERLYDLARKAGASDLVFLTGDSHAFWANRLADVEGRSAGVEIGTSGVTSPGDFVASGFGEELSRKLDSVFAENIPEVVWTDNMHQGYVRVELERNAGAASYVAVDTVLSPDYRTKVIKRVGLAKGEDRVDFA